MAANKKPRKKYRPKPICSPCALVSYNNSKLREDEYTKVLLAMHSSMHSFTHGTATSQDWTNLAEVLNLAVVLDEQVWNSSYHEALDLGSKSHYEAGCRYMRTNKMGYTGPELQAMNYALEIHEEQVRQMNLKELRIARNEALRRIANGTIKYRVPSKAASDQAAAHQAQDTSVHL